MAYSMKNHRYETRQMLEQSAYPACASGRQKRHLEQMREGICPSLPCTNLVTCLGDAGVLMQAPAEKVPLWSNAQKSIVTAICRQSIRRRSGDLSLALVEIRPGSRGPLCPCRPIYNRDPRPRGAFSVSWVETLGDCVETRLPIRKPALGTCPAVLV